MRVAATPSLSGLLNLLQAGPGLESTLFADLSLGSWRPHQLACEWAESAGLDASRPEPVQGTAAGPFDTDQGFAVAATAGIEAEANGDAVVRAAFAAARHIFSALSSRPPCRLVAIAPRSPDLWREEDRLFLRFAAEASEGSHHEILLITATETPCARLLPPGFTWEWVECPAATAMAPQTDLACLPGILPRGLAQRADPGVGFHLSDGRMLVAPELRARNYGAATLDRLRPGLAEWHWLAAYAHFAGSNYHLDPAVLAESARMAFGAEAPALALQYLERAVECARGPLRLGLLCQLQGYRIATHRFAQAAQARYPDSLGGRAGAFLAMSRGWGYALEGDAEAALTHLEHARSLADANPEAAFGLFLKNITALALAKAGRTQEALALEHEIECENEGAARLWPMHYVNQINLGRLYSGRRDFDAAERHYDEAFATQIGGRTAVDRFYCNAVRARLAAARKEPPRCHWFRAALHFAAWDTPEALGRRHAGIVGLEKPDNGFPADRVEQVARAMCQHLGFDDLPRLDSPRPDLVASDALPPVTPEAILMGNGWSVVSAPERFAHRAPGLAMQRLRHGLADEILRLARPPDRLHIGTLVVDSRLGREVAQDETEAAEVALRLGCHILVREGRTLELPQSVRDAAVFDSRVRLNPLVRDVTRAGDKVTVHYKRYRRSQTITDVLGLVSAAESGATVREMVGEHGPAAIRDLREMESNAFVSLHPPGSLGGSWDVVH